MHSRQRFFIFAVLALACCLLTANSGIAAVFGGTKTLSIGNKSGAIGETVSLGIKVDDPTGVGGAAFTIQYPADVLSFAGLDKDTRPISDGSEFATGGSGALTATGGSSGLTATAGAVEYTGYTAQDIADNLWYQFNDIKDNNGNAVGTVLVAAASAQELSTTTLFRAKFTINGGNGTYPINLLRTIIDNPAAGYSTPQPLPVLVGMPPATPDANGYYPTPLFPTTLQAGSVTVNAPGYGIAGTANYDTAGGPAADGSRVLLQQEAPAGSSLFATLDSTVVQNGTYAFGNRPDGTYRLKIEPADPRYYVQKSMVTVNGADATNNFVLAKAETHSGTVFVNGSPLAGVRVRIYDGSKLVAEVPTDDQGNYLTPPLPPGVSYTFKAVYGNTENTLSNTDSQTADDIALTLRTISGNISITGTKTVLVEAESASTGLRKSTTVTAAPSQANPYTIADLLPANDIIVSATAFGETVLFYDGATAKSQATAVDTSSADAGGIDFSYGATAQGTVSGKVVKNGSGVDGITVYAFDPVNVSLVATRTESGTGAYSFTLAPGSAIIFARTGSGNKAFYYSDSGTVQTFAAATTLVITDQSNLTDKDIDLTECGNSISGKVTLERADGNGLQYAMVTVSNTVSSATDFTGADGSYTISGLCDGSYKVIMDPVPLDNYPVQSQSVTLQSSNGTANFIVTTGNTLSGTVTTDDDTSNPNAPVAGARIILRDSVTGLRIGNRAFFTDQNGQYAIKDVKNGVYDIRAQHPDYQPGKVDALEITGDTTQDFSLTAGAFIYGTVTDNDTGNPIGGALVVAIATGKNPVRVTTRRDGSYRLRGLDTSGSYILLVDKKGYDAQLDTTGYTPANTEGSGNKADVTLSKPTSTFTLSGVITDCNGALEGARVIATYDPGGNQRKFFRTAKSDANGAYTMTNLPQHTGYSLIVVPKGNLRAPAPTAFDPTGQTAVTQDVTVDCGSSITGTVTVGATPDDGKVFVAIIKVDGTQESLVDYDRFTVTNGSAGYQFNYLDSSVTYKLVAGASNNVSQWYGSSDNTRANATEVSAGGTADFTLTAK